MKFTQVRINALVAMLLLAVLGLGCLLLVAFVPGADQCWLGAAVGSVVGALAVMGNAFADTEPKT